MKLSFFILFLSCLSANILLAQYDYLPLDTLSKDDLKLNKIYLRQFNYYHFNTAMESDSSLLVLPEGLPKGYYEVYYKQDTNRLALAYYNTGRAAFVQQFYLDGSMKSDTECNTKGKWHGLHIVYARDGNEIWHAEYQFGELDKRYRLDYLAVENSTAQAIATQKAFGKYTFSSTPSRARHDQIELLPNGTFNYHLLDQNDRISNTYAGTWSVAENYITLRLSQDNIWLQPTRKFAITATVNLTALELIEVKEWGVDWYYSEYKKEQ